jgi:transglutaminase-like putative cysteine protease
MGGEALGSRIRSGYTRSGRCQGWKRRPLNGKYRSPKLCAYFLTSPYASRLSDKEALVLLLGNRYCEADRLSEIAWSLFGKTPLGRGRVQAICDYVHQHIAFGEEHARYSRTAREAFCDRTGVCRNYAHLAVALCRCMTIPARYCTGYLGYIGVPATDFRSLLRSLSI